MSDVGLPLLLAFSLPVSSGGGQFLLESLTLGKIIRVRAPVACTGIQN